MGPLAVVEVFAERGVELAAVLEGVDVDALVFHASPQALDEDVVVTTPAAVHVDLDAMALEDAGEGIAGELAALIGVEDLGRTVFRQRFVERTDTEGGTRVDRSRKSARHHRPA